MIALAATVAVLATPALPGAPHQRTKLAASEVAPYPPMQWHSWGLFTHEDLISEKNMEEMASALISSGMAAAGYSTINVVCNGWIGRDPKTGMLLENRTLWPNGIKGFAASLHARGMKLGCYTGTCSDGRSALRNPCPTSARRSRNMPYMLVVHSHTALTPPHSRTRSRTHSPTRVSYRLTPPFRCAAVPPVRLCCTAPSVTNCQCGPLPSGHGCEMGCLGNEYKDMAFFAENGCDHVMVDNPAVRAAPLPHAPAPAPAPDGHVVRACCLACLALALLRWRRSHDLVLLAVLTTTTTIRFLHCLLGC